MHAPKAYRLGTAAAILSLVLWAAAATPARARDTGTFSVEVLVDGVPLTEYDARHRTYVEAIESREYAIRLANRTSRRVAVALSVDGLNSIDAKTTSARSASKWILGPWETITLNGWQVGADSARRFFFTTEEKSYGAWLGKTSNLGIISAAVFRERPSDPAPVYRRPIEKEERHAPADASGDRDALSDAPAPSSKMRRDARVESDSGKAGREAGIAPPPSKELAATGIGRKFDHRVHRVRFEAEPGPPTVVEIRYEYRDALIRLGALPPSHPYWEDPLERREHAQGFLGFEFAPDPYN